MVSASPAVAGRMAGSFMARQYVGGSLDGQVPVAARRLEGGMAMGGRIA
jgi:hypothetical protein